MGRLIKWIFILILLGALAVVAYAFLGDMSAPTEDVVKPVTIDVD